MARNGTDSLVNHTFKGLVEGVSEQINEARRETQVDEMVNCIPHISRGVIRRNPVDYVSTLKDKDGVTLLYPEDFFVYTYDRGTEGEQYMMLIGDQKWYTFNINTGENIGQYNDDNNIGNSTAYLNTNLKSPKEVFSLVTVGDYTWISNNQIQTSLNNTTDNLTIYDYKKNCVYWIKKTENKIVKQSPTTGEATIQGLEYSLEVSDYKAKVEGGNQSLPLLKTSQIAAELASLLNGGEISSTKIWTLISTQYSTTNIFESPFSRTLKTGEYFVAENAVDNPGSYVYVWNGKKVKSDSYTRYIKGDIQLSPGVFSGKYKFYKITKEEYRYPVSTLKEGNWKSKDEFIFNTSLYEEDDIRWSDSAGNSASFGFKGTISSILDLPNNLPSEIGNITIKIDNSLSAETGEEFWMSWNKEYWSETRQPGLRNHIDESTMPHTFVRDFDTEGNEFFRFGFYGKYNYNTEEGRVIEGSSRWGERLVGDENTAPVPSFIGSTISSIFFHNNRFGILSNDNIIMSELGIYGNFFPTTIRTIPSTDPIDVTAATTDVTTLKTAASISGSLLLFSETSQFILTSTSGSLTPESAVISNVSSYNYNPKAPAKVIGNKIFFNSESGNGTQMFDFELNSVLTTGSENVAANNRSLHIPTYLPIGMQTIIGHSILGYVFMYSKEEPKNIYVLNTLTVDGQSAQSAFHKWTFEYNIVGINIVKNNLNILFNNGIGLVNTNMQLDIPSNIANVNYTDDFDSNRTNTFESELRLSKWQIKGAEGLGTPRGRLQIRTAQFTITKSSEYTINVVNDSLIDTVVTDWLISEGVWNDTKIWDDTSVWLDGVPYKARIYDNDDKITIASNAENTYIIIKNNRINKHKGFELATINLEGFFRQRSTRY